MKLYFYGSKRTRDIFNEQTALLGNEREWAEDRKRRRLDAAGSLSGDPLKKWR